MPTLAFFSFLIWGTVVLQSAATDTQVPGEFDVKTFHIQLSDELPRLKRLVKDARLPENPEYPGLADSFGFDLDYLRGNCLKQSNFLGAHPFHSYQVRVD